MKRAILIKLGVVRGKIRRPAQLREYVRSRAHSWLNSFKSGPESNAAETLNQGSPLCKYQLAYSFLGKVIDLFPMAAKVVTYNRFIAGAAASSQRLPSDAQVLAFFANGPV